MSQTQFDYTAYEVIEQNGRFYSFLIEADGTKDIIGGHDTFNDALDACEAEIKKLLKDE